MLINYLRVLFYGFFTGLMDYAELDLRDGEVGGEELEGLLGGLASDEEDADRGLLEDLAGKVGCLA